MLDSAFQYQYERIGRSFIIHADCFEWLGKIPENSLHAIVTDPPYGVKEYDFDQLEKRANGNGGIWRIPPSFDGHTRSPLPRFTALQTQERKRLRRFFVEWARLAVHALRPGGHVFIATNAFIAQLLYEALVEGGLEFRGQIIRLVRTLRGGDRPKNAEKRFPEVCSMPRGCYEPWGIFRKPMLPRMKVSDCLKQFQTGGLRRLPNGNPFADVIASEKTPRAERKIASHPSLKPQSFLRQIAYVSLPLGEGIIVDPFMGSGSTIAVVASSPTLFPHSRHPAFTRAEAGWREWGNNAVDRAVCTIRNGSWRSHFRGALHLCASLNMAVDAPCVMKPSTWNRQC